MLSRLSERVACVAGTLMVVGWVALGGPLPAATAATPSAASASSAGLSEGVGLGARPSVRVRRVQRILDRRGFDLGQPGVDGRFGPLTAAAVRRMQDMYGLIPDGIVGPKTRRLLSVLAVGQRTQRRTQHPQTPSVQRPRTPGSPGTHRRPASPAQAAQPHAAQADRTTLPLILSIVATLLAAAALAAVFVRQHRHADATALVALKRDLFVEGSSDQPDVGAFRGMALATAVAHRTGGDPGDTRYLIDDPLKPAPVWVRGSDIRRSPSQLAPREPVIGYVTTNPDAAHEQEAFIHIEAMCEQAGWDLQEIIRDQQTGRMPDRPGLRRALEQIAAGEARGLVVTDTRSMIGSLSDLGALLDWFRDADAALVALDLDLDTVTAPGHQTATTLITVAGWESELLSGRARGGLVEVENHDRTSGNAREDGARLVQRIEAMRGAGMSLQAIADQLNNEGVPPLRGTTWRVANVKSAVAKPATLTSVRHELPFIPREGQR